MVTKYTKYKLEGTVNSSGNISVTSDSVTRGKVHACYIEYPSNSVAVQIKTNEPVSQTILNLSAASTDAVVYPRRQQEDNTGAGVTYDGTNEIYERYMVFGQLKLECNSGTDGDVVKAHVLVEEY